MGGINDFRELVAWQLAHQLQLLAQELCERPAVRTHFNFCDQQFARIAKASEVEVLNQFVKAHDKGWLTGAEFRRHEHAVKKALKAVNGWIRYLESTPNYGRGKAP